LRDEFETFVGYAQRRFFDEPTAVAMARSLDRLLTLLLEAPVLGLDVWSRHDRTQAEQAGPLLVDRDFCCWSCPPSRSAQSPSPPERRSASPHQ
jgi:hypothetical protein